MASHGEDVPGDETEKKTAPLSFGFTKTVSKFKPSSVEGVTEREDKDYLTGIDGKELQSTKPSEKPKELIIPLIQKNRWHHRADRAAPSEPSVATEAKTQEAAPENDSVESQAVKELIEDSRRQLEEWQNGPQAENLNLYIPLLMQNQVPEGFEDGDHVKVDLRPES
ncbi:G-patch domain and KOW motifs-containing protein, partial [Notothenia coriiceps]|uniref:G-patch domain and KOW motifs-containing protein n=1 Tax=Notothenia coriiceps TaxID=8208 RepID=A0A6I9NJK6_9TELE